MHAGSHVQAAQHGDAARCGRIWQRVRGRRRGFGRAAARRAVQGRSRHLHGALITDAAHVTAAPRHTLTGQTPQDTPCWDTCARHLPPTRNPDLREDFFGLLPHLISATGAQALS